MARPPRPLTEEELALWHHVTRNVTPQSGRVALSPPRRPSKVDITPDATPHERAPAPSVPLPSLKLGANDGLDRRTAQKFARGQMPVEARLDLHGMTLHDAHRAVVDFIRRSAESRRRCVLIITGKGGKGFSNTPGRIRSEAVHWLSQPSLRPHILAIREAGPREGGTGALRILLKRQRHDSAV